MSTSFCSHYSCRCSRAQELIDIGDQTRNLKFLVDATMIHKQRVPCRLSLETIMDVRLK